VSSCCGVRRGNFAKVMSSIGGIRRLVVGHGRIFLTIIYGCL